VAYAVSQSMPRLSHRLTAATLVTLAIAASSLTGSVSCGPPKDSKSTDAGDPPAPGCPFEVPEQEARCPEVGLQCEFGGEDRVACNSVATCTDLGWLVIPPDERCTPNDEGCPNDSFDITRGGACTAYGMLCSYPAGTCACDGTPSPGGSDWKFTWTCTDPVGDCPAIRPQLGGRCFDEGKRCSYGGCNIVVHNVTQSCVGGVWRRVEDECNASDAGVDAITDG
jgi:hypothetical protein